MAEWTGVLTRWCEDQPGLVPFTGQCAVHRGQILRAHGSFHDALDELALAAERYAANGMDPAAGLALYERGEVLRTLGDLTLPRRPMTRPATWGHEPQPGAALLWLARGRTRRPWPPSAACSTRRDDPVTRSRRLGAAVEVLVAAGELDEARASVCRARARSPSPSGANAVTATRAYAAGLVALARDDPVGVPHAPPASLEAMDRPRRPL